MPGAVDAVKSLAAVLAVLAALFVCGLYGVACSEMGLEEAEELAEAGVSRPCYDAVRDSLAEDRPRAVRHVEVVLAVRAIRRNGTGWPRGRAGDTPPCP